MRCSSKQSEHCSLQLSSEKSLNPKLPTFQTQVNGVGNGMTVPKHGYYIGPICQMPVKDAQCCPTVAAWLLARETTSVIKLDFAVAHCASVKEAAQTVLVTKFQN